MDPNVPGSSHPSHENQQEAYSSPGATPPPPPPADFGVPPPPQYNAPPPPVAGGAITSDERLWGSFMHLSAIVAGILGAIFHAPLICFLGPLVLWLVKRNDSRFLDDQGKEALNFNITVLIAFAVTFLICLPFWLIIIGIFLWWMSWGVISLVALILSIIAAIKANSGEYYRYPFTLRLIR